jgi:hypothetical protein
MYAVSSNVRESLTNNHGEVAPAKPTHNQGDLAMQDHNFTSDVRDSLTNVPSIASSAMLVELSVSHWTGKKKDKRASEDVTADNHAHKGVANVHKKLLGNCAELDTVQKFVANSRNLHYSMTMPWSDTGMRLLPTAQYFKYHEQMTAIQNEFAQLVDNFLQRYADEVVDAQVTLGSLFNHDDYPTADSLAGKFAFRLSYIPLPDAGDFRLDVNNDAMTQMQTQYQDYYGRQLKNAMNDVWKRVYDSLSKMSERLDYQSDEYVDEVYTDKNGETRTRTRNVGAKTFRDSLVSNVTDMVELLHVCNVTGDSQMSALANQLDETLRGVTPDALREDAYLRAQTKRAVDNVIKSLPSLDI